MNQQTEVGDCLLSLYAESFIFQSAFQKYKHQDIRNNNFACCFCMGVELGHSHWGRNVCRGCL